MMSVDPTEALARCRPDDAHSGTRRRAVRATFAHARDALDGTRGDLPANLRAGPERDRTLERVRPRVLSAFLAGWLVLRLRPRGAVAAAAGAEHSRDVLT